MKYFEGTPIPTSIVFVIALAVLHQFALTGATFPGGHWNVIGKGLHPFSILYLISGSLMISTIKVPKP